MSRDILLGGRLLLAGEGGPSPTAPRVAQTEWPGVTVELTSVERASGDTLLLNFAYRNQGTTPAAISQRFRLYIPGAPPLAQVPIP